MTTEVPPAADGRRPDSPARRIDAACDRFEAAWRGGHDPRMEDFLDGAAEPERPALLRALITLELELRRGRGERPTPGEYHDRFPGQTAPVDAAFAETALGPGRNRPRPSRAREDTSRSLLLGLLALQNNFIDRDTLMAAFSSWVANRSRALGEILVERGALSASRHLLLEALVEEHIRLHDDDAEQSLAALSSIGSVREDLERIGDADLQASLATTACRPAGSGGEAGPRTDSSPSRRPGGRFRILRFHREGGLGRVYVARDEELGREVALKEIRPDIAVETDLRGRFVLEAEINGGLEHPGIVPVYSLGTYDDGRPFYAMRFVEGDSLHEAIEKYHKEHPQPDPSAVEFRKLLGRFIDVCEAIAIAHSKGVLHRDLKPHNVMLGRYGETLLIDWGLAKATGRRHRGADHCCDNCWRRPFNSPSSSRSTSLRSISSQSMSSTSMSPQSPPSQSSNSGSGISGCSPWTSVEKIAGRSIPTPINNSFFPTVKAIRFHRFLRLCLAWTTFSNSSTALSSSFFSLMTYLRLLSSLNRRHSPDGVPV
jgi:hypothetical protein